MAKKTAWYVCPNCRSRVAVEQPFAGEIRCRNCSTLLRPAPENAGATTTERAQTRRAVDEDEYRLAPLSDEHAPPQERSTQTGPTVYTSELERLRARRNRLSTAETTQPPHPPAATPVGMPSDAAEVRDDQRYKPEPPPRWAFFSGVFTYPSRPQSLLPWLVLSLGIAMLAGAALLILFGLTSGTREGVIMAGFFILGLVWLLVLTGSYAAACLFAVTETTAYNFDAPYDWPEPDWRERFTHFLWVGWCAGLALALAVLPASLVSESLQDRALIIVIGVGLLFPVFVLSTMETNSLVPFSGPIGSSLVRQSVSWIIFYLLSTTIVGLSGAASYFLFGWLGLPSVLVLGPLWSTAVLIYARLLGRLAWRIMQPGEKQLQAWRKAHQSSLAGESRQRTGDDGDLFGDIDAG